EAKLLARGDEAMIYRDTSRFACMGKVACNKCGAEILTSTAEETGGLCMPCKLGTREQIDAGKRCYEELKKYDPFRELWKSLVNRVYHTKEGYSGLRDNERLYYAVSVLQGEVYNGGMHQYFSATSESKYRDAIAALKTLQAENAHKLVLKAKSVLFGDGEPPF